MWILLDKKKNDFRYYYCLPTCTIEFNLMIGSNVIETAKLWLYMSKSKMSYPTGMSCS